MRSRLVIQVVVVLAAAAGCSDGDRSTTASVESGRLVVPWSPFVVAKGGGNAGAAPVKALPDEIRRVHSLNIESDVDGLAVRIAAGISSTLPALRVETVHDAPFDPTDAALDFTFECRCKRAGMPDGFFVTEAVLFKRPVLGGLLNQPVEPARILFHWTYSEPAWRKRVPVECFGQEPFTESCKTSFAQADIGFVEPLVDALSGALDSR